MFIKGYEVYVAMSDTKFAGMVLAGLMTQTHVPQAITVIHSKGISYPEWQPFCELMMDRGCEVRTWCENLFPKPVHFGKLRIQQIKAFQGEIITLLDDDIILSSEALSTLNHQCAVSEKPQLPKLVQADRFKPDHFETGIQYLTGKGGNYPDAPHFPPYGLTAFRSKWRECLHFLKRFPIHADAAISCHFNPVVQFGVTATMVKSPSNFSFRPSLSQKRGWYKREVEELLNESTSRS